MSFCLPKFATENFLKALKEGKIQPEKLIEMTSEERRNFLADIIGKDDAKEVNALLESKLLLKDQKRGMVSWAKKVGGISEEVRHDMISKIEKMDKVLEAKDEQTFLEDLASKKLGTEVSFEEAKHISELSKSMQDARAKINETDKIGSDNRIQYGAQRVALQEYMKELKLENSSKTIETRKAEFKVNPRKAMAETIAEIGGISKGINASFDNSFAGRQGFRAIFTNPVEWVDNFINSFKLIGEQLGKKANDNTIIDGVKADIFSRPNAINGNYSKMKLAVGIDSEEAYPSALPEKIPVLGRFYKASETAYNGMAIRLRADIADKLIKLAESNGVNLNDKLEIESLGRLVNSLTGRGHLGESGERVAGKFNTVFFSPRSVKANFDFLTLHALDPMSKFARKQSAINLLKVSAGIATIMGLANALYPKSAETDPRSADFGKIRIGNTRIDISGGMLGLVILASRLLTGESKSSTTGRVTDLTKGGFGAPNRLDTILNFAENKTAPLTSNLISWLKGKDFNGNKPTVAETIKNLITPLPVSNVMELMNSKKAMNPLIAEMLDAIGFVTNTYGK